MAALCRHVHLEIIDPAQSAGSFFYAECKMNKILHGRWCMRLFFSKELQVSFWIQALLLRLQINFVKAHCAKRLTKDTLFVSAKTGRNRDASVKISILKCISPFCSTCGACDPLKWNSRCGVAATVAGRAVSPMLLYCDLLQLPPFVPHAHDARWSLRHRVMCPSLSNHQP